jgi:hypothetical protein
VSPRALVLAFAMSLAATSAEAPPVDRAAADSLLDAGRRALADGRLNEACAQLAESHRLVAQPETLATLATCHERQGKTATAWSDLREAERLAVARGGDPAALRARIAALDPSVPRLVIVVAVRGGEPVVRRDGQLAPPATWGLPVAVDPGDHVIELEVPGERTSRVVRAVAGQTTRVDLGAAPGGAGSGDLQRPVGFVLGGLGVATIAGGVALRLTASSRHSSAVARCNAAPQAYCDDAAKSQQSDAESLATLGGAAFFLGAGALIAGGVLVLTSKSAPASSALRVTPLIGASGAGLSIGGAL